MSWDEPREGTGAVIADDRLAEIRRRAEASAEGPFDLRERGFGDYDAVPVDEAGEMRGELAGIRGVFMGTENAEFFRHAREDVLALLDALEEAERRAEGGGAEG